jgi:hypothetical protein
MFAPESINNLSASILTPDPQGQEGHDFDLTDADDTILMYHTLVTTGSS